MKITQCNTWFVVELGDNKIHMLNEKSLRYHLKKVIGLPPAGVASVMHYLACEPTPLSIDLRHTEAKIVKQSA